MKSKFIAPTAKESKLANLQEGIVTGTIEAADLRRTINILVTISGCNQFLLRRGILDAIDCLDTHATRWEQMVNRLDAEVVSVMKE